jgi:transcriptional regulator with XRE-family HTH domain
MRPTSPIADVRALRGISQARLARRLGRSQALISRWESGERLPTALDLASLAYELATDPARLATPSKSGTTRQRRSRYSDRHLLAALGAEVQRARRKRQLTPLQIAVSTAIRPRRLRRIEAGAEPSPAELASLAAVCGTTIRQLLLRASREGLRRKAVARSG